MHTETRSWTLLVRIANSYIKVKNVLSHDTIHIAGSILSRGPSLLLASVMHFTEKLLVKRGMILSALESKFTLYVCICVCMTRFELSIVFNNVFWCVTPILRIKLKAL